MFANFNDDIWDEHQWEAHLNEIARQNTQLRKFIAPDPSDGNPRWLILLRENGDERETVDAYIEEELQFDDHYFEDDELDNDEFDDPFWDEWDEEEYLFDEEEDFDAGEEWKELSDEFTLSGNGSIEMLDIYNNSRDLAVLILKWIEDSNPRHLTNPYSDFVGKVLKIGAKIAGGYAFGFEREFLGGNIAYTKKALHCANDSLTILQRDLKGTPLISRKQYLNFHRKLFELRNDIGIYIQELREQFYTGL